VVTPARRFAKGVVVALLCAASCAFAAAVEDALPVWPAAPEAARIRFVRSFACAEDLGIRKGFLARLKDFIFGEADSHVVRPMAVVADGEFVYVADPGARGVHRFDVAGGDYALIGGPDDTPLPSPVGLARGADGEIYVTDSMLAQVFVIRPGQQRAQPLQLGAVLVQPTGIAYDAAVRRLYVTDTGAHRIEAFDRSGAHVAQIGARGSGDGEFNFPTYLWLGSHGRLYVTDSLNYRVEVFDANGRFMSKLGRQGGGTGEAARPKGVATDREGHIYLVDALFHAVQVFDEAGRLLLPIGQIGQERGEFWLPTGIFIDPDTDLIYVADSYNRRVQVLRYVGGPG
jgi:sugar lactone lactonase YvrE